MEWLGGGGTLPLFFCKSVIPGELHGDFLQECDSKVFTGGKSSRRTPAEKVTRLISAS
jgi:hypothetical protein